MKNRRFNILAIIVALAIPAILGLLVPNLLDVLNLSRKSTHGIRLPQRYFAQGVDPKTQDTIYHTVPNYKFQTQSGDSLALDSLRNNLYVVNFFFATCPGICPKLSNSMERIQDAFIKDQQLKLVSITVDPARDTMEAIRAYADNHRAIPGKWYFLRGSQSDVANLASTGLHITARPDDGNGNEAFVHSEKMVIVDGKGVIRGYYSGIDSLSVNHLMSDVVLLLKEMNEGFSFRRQKKTTKKLFEN